MEYTHESKDADIKRLFDLVYTMGGIKGEIQVDGCNHPTGVLIEKDCTGIIPLENLPCFL